MKQNKDQASSSSSSNATTTPSNSTTPTSKEIVQDDAHKYSLSFDNVIKGPLKLKGRKGTIGGIKKQHKTNTKQKTLVVAKTEAEEKYEAKSMERKKKLIKERAQKSYREKINEFNDRISKLTEYNDVPKV